MVVVVVDQLGAGMLEPLQPQLAGGFARFLKQGRGFSRCAHDHAGTLTGPGHATLLTGVHPARHGILRNEWFDRGARQEVSCAEAPPGSGARNFDGTPAVTGGYLRVESLGDLMKRADRESRVFSVSLKDRAAALAAGRSPDGVFWFNARQARFTSNPALTAVLPSWGREFWNGELLPPAAGDARIPEAWSYPIRPSARPDDHPRESADFSRLAPHPISSGRALRASPWGDWLTLELARQIIEHEALGADGHADLLVVALSATDYIGHAYGPGSQEHLDQLLRLDGWLGEFMQAADAAAARGGRGVLYALSSDHGVLPLPEEVPGGRRLSEKELLDRIHAAAGRALGGAGLIQAIVAKQIYLDHRALDAAGIPPGAAARRVQAELSSLPGIARVFTSEELSSTVRGDRFLELQRHSWRADRGGDLVVQICEGCLMTDDPTGTTHGTPYEYDRRVPLFLLGAGIGAGDSEAECRTIDLAPTVASLLGLPRFDSPRDGRPLPLGRVDTQDPLK